MTPTIPSVRPFYQSRLFWGGLLGALLICWSWRDSFRYVRSFHTPDQVEEGTSVASYFSFHSRVGILGVSHERTDYSQRQNPTLPDRGFTAQSTSLSMSGWTKLREKNRGAFRFPVAFFKETDKEIETSYFYLAHWSFLLVYLAAWRGAYCLRTFWLRCRLGRAVPSTDEDA